MEKWFYFYNVAQKIFSSLKNTPQDCWFKIKNGRYRRYFTLLQKTAFVLEICKLDLSYFFWYVLGGFWDTFSPGTALCGQAVADLPGNISLSGVFKND